MHCSKRANMEVDESTMDMSIEPSAADRREARETPLPHKKSPSPSKYKPLPPRSYEDWQYRMRREMQEIIPDLYLGPYAAASKSQLENLKREGITHIICVRHLVERSVIRPVHGDNFKYLVIEMADDSTEMLIPHCHKVQKFLDECFSDGGKCLVHGNSGNSRPAALVVGYVMSTYGVSMKQALNYVQTKRFSAMPNDWFQYQLKEYEPIYMAQHDVPIDLPGDGECCRPSVKRCISPLEFDDLDF